MFVSFDGVEGCGKTTQIKKLLTLIPDSVAVSEISKDFSSDLGKVVRDVVLNHNIDTQAKIKLIKYLRYENYDLVKNFKNVFLDRYTATTFAYHLVNIPPPIEPDISFIFDRASIESDDAITLKRMEIFRDIAIRNGYHVISDCVERSVECVHKEIMGVIDGFIAKND